MSAACGAGTEKQRGTRVRPGAPADGRPTTPSLRDCLWTPVWAHGGQPHTAVPARRPSTMAHLAENYGTLCRRRSSAQPAQMQLLAPRLLEAASSTSRQVSRQASQAAFIGSACNGLFPRPGGLSLADRRSVTRRMCRSSTKEVTCTSQRISKLYMAYEQIDEGLPGVLKKNMRKTWAPRAHEPTRGATKADAALCIRWASKTCDMQRRPLRCVPKGRTQKIGSPTLIPGQREIFSVSILTTLVGRSRN